MRFSSESGQSTVEAAVLIPVIFLVFGLFLQPCLLLYNRCVMNEAASEACRLIATSTGDDANVRAYVERRLDAVPDLGIFHEGETWDVSWARNGNGSDVSVQIVNHARPLPLFGIMAQLSDSMTADGLIEQRVESSCSPTPQWIGELGSDAKTWIGAWK